jgi:Aspartyl protease
MKKVVIVLLASILFVNEGIAQKGAIEIPFTMDRNLMLVKAKVNNKKEYSFVYDAGTPGFMLSETLVKESKLKVTGITSIQSPNSAQPDKVNTVAVQAIKLNGFEVLNPAAVAVPPQQIFSPNASGMMGLSAFKGYLVTIDFKNSKLILTKGQLNISDKAVIKVDLAQVPQTNVNVNGVEMLAHFDCGGPEHMSFPLEWKSKLKLKAEPALFARGMTPTGEIEIYKAQLVGTISFGSIELKDPFITMVTGGFPAISFGSPFFQKYKPTFDMNNQLMRLEDVSSGK